MTPRRAMPMRRAAETVRLTQPGWGNVPPREWLATVGRRIDADLDGEVTGTLEVAELFLIDPHDPTGPMAVTGGDAAVLISIALQHGVPAAEMRAAMARGEDGKPHSIIGTALDLLVESQSLPDAGPAHG